MLPGQMSLYLVTSIKDGPRSFKVLIISKEVFEANTIREFKLFRVGGLSGLN